MCVQRLLIGIFEHCDLKIGTAICTAIAKKIGEANPKTLGRTAKEDLYHVRV
ncbi:hypothetical protein K504DRAFT_465711 [Pleomassaria siparia CBS 279.74]|uniref:Uncharacterized protein n=1 Tax=Pleomassaria siparia CBS 279.74 TaxID=1314801 RepID=A0A6G1JQK4_9PLEO|nr:hypothetical protein K504DRAFT_465711 [Pleomassaria siparia CBS 279.74]